MIGKPTSYRANQASTSEDNNHGEMFSQLQEDLEKLQKRMQAMASNHSPSTAHLADSGNVCLHTSASHPWVNDSGASDHMTGKEEIFQSLHRSTSSSCVTLANGSKSQILGSGIVRPCKDITLSSVLLVDQCPYNLMSVSHITKSLNCSVTFFPTHCVFQDLKTKQMIGGGYEQSGLYYFHDQQHTALATTVSPLQWHQRLGHLPLNKLRSFVPSISSSCQLECEVCEFAKHHRTTYNGELKSEVIHHSI